MKLSREVIKLSRNTLVIELRFMDTAISRLNWQEHKGTLAVDGQLIFYDPLYLLRLYTAEKEQVPRAYLHMIMHCVFRHFIVPRCVDRKLWDLSCDIAVESVISELHIKRLHIQKESGRDTAAARLKRQIGLVTADKLYRYFKSVPTAAKSLFDLFAVDDHSPWYDADDAEDERTSSRQNSSADRSGKERKDPKEKRSAADHDDDRDDGAADSDQDSDAVGIGRNNKGSGNGQDDADRDDDRDDESADSDRDSDAAGDGRNNKGSGNGQGDADFPGSKSGKTSGERQNRRPIHPNRTADMEEDWKDISRQIQMDLESFSKQQGDEAGSMMQNLREVNREKYDYSAFLRKFAVPCEAMKINEDEFDYIFYTYGMKLFPEKRMPLIEPLEYKDVKSIREFVIAIDTSGSVAGEIVQKFIQKTYNILKSTESFTNRVNLHIIQCDTQIQEHVRINTQREFDEYIKRMTIKGLGGTDFRPVFRFVDDLVSSGEFVNLKGLIYFTDGFGVFPEKKPTYRTVFVFLEEDYINTDVPPWAAKLILKNEEIQV